MRPVRHWLSVLESGFSAPPASPTPRRSIPCPLPCANPRPGSGPHWFSLCPPAPSRTLPCWYPQPPLVLIQLHRCPPGRQVRRRRQGEAAHGGQAAPQHGAVLHRPHGRQAAGDDAAAQVRGRGGAGRGGAGASRERRAGGATRAAAVPVGGLRSGTVAYTWRLACSHGRLRRLPHRHVMSCLEVQHERAPALPPSPQALRQAQGVHQGHVAAGRTDRPVSGRKGTREEGHGLLCVCACAFADRAHAFQTHPCEGRRLGAQESGSPVQMPCACISCPMGNHCPRAGNMFSVKQVDRRKKTCIAFALHPCSCPLPPLPATP